MAPWSSDGNDPQSMSMRRNKIIKSKVNQARTRHVQKNNFSFFLSAHTIYISFNSRLPFVTYSSVYLLHYLHLHDGAVKLQTPLFWHCRVPFPTKECSFGHLYSMLLPTVKFLPTTVVFCCMSGDPHDNGAVFYEYKIKEI